MLNANYQKVNVAIWEKAVPFQPNDLVFKEGNFTACLGYVQKDFKDVIQAISSGKLNMRCHAFTVLMTSQVQCSPKI